MAKSPDAFRTISEVSEWLDTPAHVLRFWESRFPQVKPVKRAGGRRYYRPNDMQLLGGIKRLLHDDGLTIKGVQKILREKGVTYVATLCLESLETAGKLVPSAAKRTKSEETPIEALLTEDAADTASDDGATRIHSLIENGPQGDGLTGADGKATAAEGDPEGAEGQYATEAVAQAANSNTTPDHMPDPQPEDAQVSSTQAAVQDPSVTHRDSDQDDDQQSDAKSRHDEQGADRRPAIAPDAAQPGSISNGRDHSQDHAEDEGDLALKPTIARPFSRPTEDAFAKLPPLDEDAQDARIIALYHRLKLLRDRLQGEIRLDHR